MRTDALDRWPRMKFSLEARQALSEFLEAKRRRREY